MHTILDIERESRGAHDLGCLLGEEYRVLHSPSCGEALASARRGGVAALLVDLDLGSGDPFGFLAAAAGLPGGPPAIVLSARTDPGTVVRALRCGAVDFLPRPPPLHELRLALARAVGRLPQGPTPFVGSSPALASIMRELRIFAAWDLPLLITGESGTGKDLAARTLHELSRRRSGPFVARNCAALPRELVESELFGSTKGAFTGAADRPGAFELARDGTLFLDEIGEATLETQATLLRVLESGEFWRLGARSVTKVELRFVSATSKVLEEAVDARRFRLDLLYRIETLRIHIPPLRERREDIAPLARHFVLEAARGRKVASPSALDRLASLEWPGNVRQLRNVVLRAIVRSEGREEIAEEDIFP